MTSSVCSLTMLPTMLHFFCHLWGFAHAVLCVWNSCLEHSIFLEVPFSLFTWLVHPLGLISDVLSSGKPSLAEVWVRRSGSVFSVLSPSSLASCCIAFHCFICCLSHQTVSQCKGRNQMLMAISLAPNTVSETNWFLRNVC